MKPSPRHVEFIEKVGRFWESIAGSRIAGRILGWLMICEPDHQSAAELVEALDASTGSVSTQIRQLEQIGFVERITFPGDRASYYRLRELVWSGLMAGEQQRIDTWRDIVAGASEILPTERPERVTELGAIADFFADEWPALMERLTRHLERALTPREDRAPRWEAS
jgi:DNA-binding transcriptional regulator GbsR (MarR family)